MQKQCLCNFILGFFQPDKNMKMQICRISETSFLLFADRGLSGIIWEVSLVKHFQTSMDLKLDGL